MMTTVKNANSARVSRHWIMASLVLILVCASMAASEQIRVDYRFERPYLEKISIEGQTFDRIVMPGLANGGITGQPSLPARGAQILIPYSSEITKIEVLAEDSVLVGDKLLIEPVPPIYPYGDYSRSAQSIFIDDSAYRSGKPVPASRYREIGTHGFRGYRILVLKLMPVSYIPATGQLWYYPNLSVIVETQPGLKRSSLFRGLSKDEAEVITRVDNPEAAMSYTAAEKSGSDNFDLMIMTLPAYVEAFQPLKDYHDSTGVSTEIHTFVDVYYEMGDAKPDDIRAYIRNRYLNDGIQYVLIGDDNFLIQVQYFCVSIPSNYLDTASIEYNMPSDLYYACLDGTFDGDGDGLFGEPNDGEDGGDVDLIAEVYVGRASVDNNVEVARFVNKTIAHMSSQNQYGQSVQLAGERTYFPGTNKFGRPSLLKMIDSSDANGYTTIGIPSNTYSVDGLFATDGNWPKEELMARINDGRHIINHVGHNSYEMAMKLELADLNTLTNTDYFLVYSHGCFCGGFDELDCWAEHVTVKIDAGAYAAIMNARMGWGTPYTTDSPSQRFNREFWDAVFNPAEDIPEIGRANQDSKEDNLYRIDEGGMRYCYYELNLLGDPAATINRPAAIDFHFADGIPSLVIEGQTLSFPMSVTGLYGGTPVAGSGRLHYSLNRGDEQTVDLTETEPNHYTVEMPTITCGDIISFRFSVEEVSGTRIFDVAPDKSHELKAILRIMTAFADDFETDKGWTVSGGSWARGIPGGQGGEYGFPDPTEGCAGPAVFGYNLNGDYENDLSEMHLTTPPINCAHLPNVHLSFSRWLGLMKPPNDNTQISISTDGSTWTMIWFNDELYVDSSWKDMAFDITEYAAYQPAVYLRWTMGPTNEAYTACGWNIDDVHVYSHDCVGYVFGDANGDTTISVADAIYIISYIFRGGPPPPMYEAADANCDGSITIADAVYLINYIFKGGPMPQC